MNSRTLELALKKQRLQIRSAALRGEFSTYVLGLAPLTKAADAGLNGVHCLRRHPQWLVAATTLLFIVRPRRVFKLGMRVWGLGRLFRSVTRFLGVI